MKKIVKSLALLAMVLGTSCEKHDFARGELSPMISVARVRLLFKGVDLPLNPENLDGAQIMAGTIISDPSGKNLPEGIIAIQSERGGNMRGIALAVGDGAPDYAAGDSVHVNLQGSILKRVNGILAITGISSQAIEQVASGVKVTIRTASAITLKNSPDAYESSLVTVYGCNYEPDLGVEKLAGDKALNDGSGDMEMHVNANAALATELLPYSSVTTGIIFPSAGGVVQIWPRIKEDFVATSIIVDPNVPLGKTPVVITGYLNDPAGADGNYEYIQFMATQDLDFKSKPFSVITTNNAGTSTPTGFPAKGWVTGDLRTYKFNLTQGTVAKGKFFYVGGNKKIWGASSTDISAATWITSVLYASEPGADGIGTQTANLLANSGNAAGIAVFAGTTVNENSIPCDVVFLGGNGNVYSPGPPAVGYRVTDNDLYDTMNGSQPFWQQGTNINKFAFPSTSNFSKLGGIYDSTLEKWTTPRVLLSVALGNASNIPELESGPGTTGLAQEQEHQTLK